MAALNQLEGPDAFPGLQRRRVKFEQLPRVMQGAEAVLQMIINAYKKMGRPPPSPDKLANMVGELQKRQATSGMGMSSTGVKDPTRPIGEGTRFSGLQSPGQVHQRLSKVDEFPFEKRDPKKLAVMQEAQTPGVLIGTRAPGGSLFTPDQQTSLMTQFPQNIIYGGMTVSPKVTKNVEAAIKAFTAQAKRQPTQKELRKIIDQTAGKVGSDTSTLDLLSFPTGSRQAAERVRNIASEMSPGGALEAIAKQIPKADPDTFFRGLLKSQAEKSRGGLDYVTSGRDLEDLEKAMKTKKIQKLIDDVLK